MTTSSPPKVPFVEALSLNEVNNWARSPKRALSRAGFMQWGEFTNVWGVNSVRACKAFQKAVRLKQTGTYTFATHEALRKRRKKGSRTEWAFDALAIAIAANNDITPLERVMFKTVDAIDYAILHRDKMLYDQIRLMRDMDPPPNVPNLCDCSQFVTWALKSGGAPDPNHLGYSGAGYCHELSARILTADLRWVAAGDIKIGDELWALDESPDPSRLPKKFAAGTGGGAGRRFRRATVIASFPSRKRCVRVTLDTEESFICSADHPWLSQTDRSRKHKWTPADKLITPRLIRLRGRRTLIRPFIPWKSETSYEAGWLAGIFDGEGWVGKHRHGRTSSIGITQVLGPTADHIVTLSRKYGDFRATTIVRDGCQDRVDLESNGGGMDKVAEFLGRIRPERLIKNFNIEGGHVFDRNQAAVVSVEEVGLAEVQSIQTTTGTYIAEGFAVHNTGTLWSNEKVSGLSSARLCDMVFYGIPWMAGGRAHVAIVREIGSRGVLVGSMGSDKGPLNIRADYRQIVGIRRPVLL